LPSIRTCPLSGLTIPARIRSRVLLPSPGRPQNDEEFSLPLSGRSCSARESFRMSYLCRRVRACSSVHPPGQIVASEIFLERDCHYDDRPCEHQGKRRGGKRVLPSGQDVANHDGEGRVGGRKDDREGELIPGDNPGQQNLGRLASDAVPCHRRLHSLSLTLRPLAICC
jgi:hypothetical protein